MKVLLGVFLVASLLALASVSGCAHSTSKESVPKTDLTLQELSGPKHHRL